LVAGSGQPLGAATSKGKTIPVKLSEFVIKPELKAVAAGKVTFQAKNVGTEKHEMVIVRVPDGAQLPTKDDGSVDEAAIPKADKFGEVANVKPKKAKKLKAKLPLGDYVLFCNNIDHEKDGTTVSHYAEGMHTTFTAA
jgi:uncharacterized cupredoxin-like copper-binding protein